MFRMTFIFHTCMLYLYLYFLCLILSAFVFSVNWSHNLSLNLSLPNWNKRRFRDLCILWFLSSLNLNTGYFNSFDFIQKYLKKITFNKKTKFLLFIIPRHIWEWRRNSADVFEKFHADCRRLTCYEYTHYMPAPTNWKYWLSQKPLMWNSFFII